MESGALVVALPSALPATTPALAANLGLRVGLALAGNLACLVPLRLLWRNGELAAAVFVLDVLAINLDTVVNALAWPDNALAARWPGFGFCDADNHFRNLSKGLYLTCLLALMRNLARQLALDRARPLDRRERRRRNLGQALVIFPLPLLQLALTWPLAAQRYAVGALSGCDWVAHPSWPYLVFFVLPPVAMGLATVVYAVLAYLRFHHLASASRSALSASRGAARRSQRARRRLYLMVLSILVPYFPIVIALALLNLVAILPLRPYSFRDVHSRAAPLPWNTILLSPADRVPWPYLNSCYIPILTTLPIFLFFGTTAAAVSQYRTLLLSLGLARLFPRLERASDPDASSSSAPRSDDARLVTITQSTASSKACSPPPAPRLDDAALHLESGRPPAAYDPLCRNPWPFRTRLDFSLLSGPAAFREPRHGHGHGHARPSLDSACSLRIDAVPLATPPQVTSDDGRRP